MPAAKNALERLLELNGRLLERVRAEGVDAQIGVQEQVDLYKEIMALLIEREGVSAFENQLQTRMIIYLATFENLPRWFHKDIIKHDLLAHAHMLMRDWKLSYCKESGHRLEQEAAEREASKGER